MLATSIASQQSGWTIMPVVGCCHQTPGRPAPTPPTCPHERGGLAVRQGVEKGGPWYVARPIGVHGLLTCPRETWDHGLPCAQGGGRWQGWLARKLYPEQTRETSKSWDRPCRRGWKLIGHLIGRIERIHTSDPAILGEPLPPPSPQPGAESRKKG